jgi:hypothetical protein
VFTGVAVDVSADSTGVFVGMPVGLLVGLDTGVLVAVDIGKSMDGTGMFVGVALGVLVNGTTLLVGVGTSVNVGNGIETDDIGVLVSCNSVGAGVASEIGGCASVCLDLHFKSF